jgi:predicted Zn-dependent protease
LDLIVQQKPNGVRSPTKLFMFRYLNKYHISMKKILLCLSCVALLLGVWSCKKNAFTGRRQFNFIPAAQLNAMSFTQYKEFVSQNKTVKTGADYDMVKRIGNDIKLAAETYYRKNNRADQLKGFQWEFNVVDDPTVNAFCMPGGKVIFYTGILRVCENEDAIATVMGHEVAHALANHGGERMSQGLATQGAMVGLDVALRDKPAQTRNLFLGAVGAGAQVGMSEADEIGLYLMAMAGYNANEAAPFWERMNKGGGARPPEFMSTHPDPAKRSATLKSLVRKAQAYAVKYPVAGTSKRK